MCGKLGDIDVVFLSRHGKAHDLSPTHVNYRANLYALKKLGVTHIVTTNACGSLQPYLKQGDLVILDQIYDNTCKRVSTFHDGTTDEFPGINHSPCADPFDENLRNVIIQSFKEIDIKCHNKGVIVVIEGPRFSTRFESLTFQKLGGELIGMTSAPEAFLAFELGIPYASIALVTDMDSWNPDVEHVNGDAVSRVFAQFVETLKTALVRVIENIAKQ